MFLHPGFLVIWLFWNKAKAFIAHVRKSTHTTKELRHLQKQQVLKPTPPGASPITNPELDESDKNEGEEGGGYVQGDDRLTRVLPLRAPVNTRWNSLYFMIKR